MIPEKNTYQDDIFHISILTSIKHRLPWLAIGLLGGIVVASIVDSFKHLLEQNIILAAFIPLIVYMADAVGTQMETFIIRDIATTHLHFWKYLTRHAFILIALGLLISVALYIISLGIYNEQKISLVLAVSLFFAIISSLITGLIVPYIFTKFKLDPANASAPIATIIQDMLSICIYFWIAKFILL